MDTRDKKDLDSFNALKLKAVKSFKNKQIEKALDYAYIAASYAWETQFGIWYDNELEGLLTEIGVNLRKNKNSSIPPSKKETSLKIAHIASSLSDAGGHSQVLKQWVGLLNEKTDKQIVYVTNSRLSGSFPDLSAYLRGKGVQIQELSCENPYLDRIKTLVNLIDQDAPDCLILYIHPNDVIVIPALCALSYKPLTIFFNHADHTFWLGKNIIDNLIDWREEGAKCSRYFRKIDSSCIIPLTTVIQPQKQSRESFNVPSNSTLSISVGSFHKVLGDPECNYFRTIEEILKKFPDHYHMLVTDLQSKETGNQYIINDQAIRRRFIITGPITNLQPVYGAADFLIETFPATGGMVRVEAMASRLPVLAFHNKKVPLLSDVDSLPVNYPFVASNKDELLLYSTKLIENAKLRQELGQELFDQYQKSMNPIIIGNLLFGIVNQNRQVLATKINTPISENIEYDMEYLRSLRSNRPQTNFYTNARLLSLSTSKHSSFSFLARTEFLIKALNNREFESSKIMAKNMVLATLGWRGRKTARAVIKIYHQIVRN